MPSTIKWSTPTAVGNVLSSELNSLADDGYSAAGTEMDNRTARNQFADVELYLPSLPANATGLQCCELYLVSAPGGTSFGDGGGAVTPPPSAWVGQFNLRAVTTAQRVTLHGLTLPPHKCRFILHNRSGQTLPGSGAVVSLYTYNPEVQ